MKNENVTTSLGEGCEKQKDMPLQVSKRVLNAVTIAAMDSVEKGEDLYGPYDTASDLMEALNDPSG
ncbi:MAG TPA: hypothetical protein DEP00_03980 [Lachnospiraceae bacterium]|nr:hypothetical protein [Lachnospiraceae bacterium]